MWSAKIERRTKRNDARRINFGVRHVIVTLDVIDVNRLGDSRVLIQVQQVPLQIGIIDNPSNVAFEVSVINDVEPDQGTEKPPIGFDDAIAKQVAIVR